MEKEFLVYLPLGNLHFLFAIQIPRQEKTKRVRMNVQHMGRRNGDMIGHLGGKERSGPNRDEPLRHDRLLMGKYYLGNLISSQYGITLV